MMDRLFSLLSGLIFGLGLTLSSMTNPAKVIGFLDITGNWDPSLMFVMIGAILISSPVFYILRNNKPLFALSFEIPKIKQDSSIIRSTNIRSLITQGKVDLASKMLGYSFFIKGVVEKGLGRGKKLGFPTANIKIPDNIILPINGIYATHVNIGNNKYFGATSIGNNPTFNETDKTIETFIIGFNDDIYNKNICLEFIHRIRDEIKFSSANKLSIQMANDVEKITNILKTTSSLLN